jgi:molybdenum ABC transporter molybdate-binding protein
MSGRTPSLLVVGCVLSLAAAGAQPRAIAIALFEGARLMSGDGRPPIENSAFLVENGRFSRVGRKGDVQAPEGAARVDLTGKTVIPALIDAHSHIGYMRDLTSGPENYTRANILDHLQRFAYFGVAASQAMGSDFGELPFQMRDEVHPGAARFLTAGRGLAPLAEIRPDNMRHAAYAVTTSQGARAAVEELARRNVSIVKTWVDDRGGTISKLTPDLYRAIIDEAHKHKMQVAVHATELQDAKDLLRSGVDILAHMVSDVDDELVELFRQHPNTAVLTALGGPRRTIYAPWLNPPHPLITETVSAAQIKRLQDRLARSSREDLERARQAWARVSSGLARLHAAGVKIGAGTDGGGQTGDQFIGWTMHTELENLVAAGMTPAHTLVAATRMSAEILGLTDLGTIAPQKSADFVVLNANPLDDITNTRTIQSVYLRGREVDRSALRETFQAAQITVLCSNGIKAAMEALLPQFEAATGRRVAIKYDLAANLKRQIEADEAFDLAIATPAVVDDLITQGRIAAGTRTNLARSGLAIMIRKGGRKVDVSTVDAFKGALVGASSIAYAREGASGMAFAALVERLGIADALRPKSQLTNSGAAVGAAVSSGAAEFGILPLSEILPVAGAEVLGPFPPEVQSYVVMVAGINARTSQRAAAESLVRFVTAPASDRAMREHGMERVPR